MEEDAYVRVVCEGSASEYHRVPAHPHLWCGCGEEADECHPGRCCRDNDFGDCVNCGREEPEPAIEATPESDLSDPLFEIGGAR